MGLALAVDGRLDVKDAVFTGFHPLDHHRSAVGNLLVAEAENLLADNLRDKHALGLVGERVVVKEVTALARLLFQLVEQLVHAAAVLRADRNHSVKVIEL